MTKSWWRSKTLWLNVAVAAGAALEMHLGLVQAMLKPQHYLAALVAINAINVALRFVTSQPIK